MEFIVTISALPLDLVKYTLHLVVDPQQHKICVKKLQQFQPGFRRRAKNKRSRLECYPRFPVGNVDGMCLISL